MELKGLTIPKPGAKKMAKARMLLSTMTMKEAMMPQEDKEIMNALENGKIIWEKKK